MRLTKEELNHLVKKPTIFVIKCLQKRCVFRYFLSSYGLSSSAGGAERVKVLESESMNIC